MFSSSGIEYLQPSKRNFYFRNEGNLEFYKEYTYSNCRFECGIQLAEEDIGCIPWYLPHGQNSTYCDPWKTMEFRKLIGKVHANDSLCGNCLPDCMLTETSVTASSAKFR